jgi:hypothetical protein
MTDPPPGAATPDAGQVELASAPLSQLDDDLARVAAVPAAQCLQHTATVLRATPSRHAVTLHAWSMGVGSEPRACARPETAALSPARSRPSTKGNDRKT